MPSINDFMVILIIPTLDYLVYPHLEKTMGYKVQSLHKVTKINVWQSPMLILSVGYIFHQKYSLRFH
jgi:hypothetical protein